MLEIENIIIYKYSQLNYSKIHHGYKIALCLFFRFHICDNYELG